MKKYITLLALVLCALVASAQKENIGYSLVIKDANGELVADKDVKIKVQVLFGDVAVNPDKIPASVITNLEYVETHNVKTDKTGVASILIGAGDVISSNVIDFSKVPFNGSNRITIEIDPDGNGYSIKGSSLLTSVPSALYATTAGTAKTADKATSATSATTAAKADEASALGYIKTVPVTIDTPVGTGSDDCSQCVFIGGESAQSLNGKQINLPVGMEVYLRVSPLPNELANLIIGTINSNGTTEGSYHVSLKKYKRGSGIYAMDVFQSEVTYIEGKVAVGSGEDYFSLNNETKKYLGNAFDPNASLETTDRDVYIPILIKSNTTTITIRSSKTIK